MSVSLSSCPGGISHSYVQILGVYVKTDDFDGLTTRIYYGESPDSLGDSYVYTGYGHSALFVPPNHFYPLGEIDSIIQDKYVITPLKRASCSPMENCLDSIDSIQPFYALKFSKGDIFKGKTELDYVRGYKLHEVNHNARQKEPPTLIYRQYDEKTDNLFNYSFGLFVHNILLLFI